MLWTSVRASKTRCDLLSFVCFLGLIPLAAEGSEPSSAQAAVDVTWPEIVRRVDEHPRVAAARELIAAARSAVQIAGAAPNPNVEAQLGRGSPRTGGEGQGEWGLTLNLPLGWIAQRGSRVTAAGAEVDATVAEAQALRRDVLVELQGMFWSLAFEQARVATLAELQAQTAALVSAVKRRADAGDIRPVETTRVEIELEKVTAELEAARTLLTARQTQLGRWLGVPRVRAVADLSALPAWSRTEAPLPEVADAPTLAAARARVRALEAEADTERRARVPAFSLTAFTVHELDRKSYGAGLTVELPLWNWNSGRIAQARAKLAAGRHQAQATAIELEGTIVEAQAACRASVATADRLGSAVVPRAQAAASTMEKTYALGEATLLDLIDARRTLLDVRRLHLSALGQAHIDCARLSTLTGEDLR